MPSAVFTSTRLQLRVSNDLHAMVRRAAEMQGRTMTDFVVAAVQDAAQRAIDRAEVMRLKRKDQEAFARALLSPPKPGPALARALSRRNRSRA